MHNLARLSYVNPSTQIFELHIVPFLKDKIVRGFFSSPFFFFSFLLDSLLRVRFDLFRDWLELFGSSEIGKLRSKPLHRLLRYYDRKGEGKTRENKVARNFEERNNTNNARILLITYARFRFSLFLSVSELSSHFRARTHVLYVYSYVTEFNNFRLFVRSSTENASKNASEMINILFAYTGCKL